MIVDCREEEDTPAFMLPVKKRKTANLGPSHPPSHCYATTPNCIWSDYEPTDATDMNAAAPDISLDTAATGMSAGTSSAPTDMQVPTGPYIVVANLQSAAPVINAGADDKNTIVGVHASGIRTHTASQISKVDTDTQEATIALDIGVQDTPSGNDNKDYKLAEDDSGEPNRRRRPAEAIASASRH
jgi:hypothetical protein